MSPLDLDASSEQVFEAEGPDPSSAAADLDGGVELMMEGIEAEFAEYDIGASK